MIGRGREGVVVRSLGEGKFGYGFEVILLS